MNNMSAADLVVNKSRREISVDSKIQPIRVTSIFGLSGGKCGCHVRWRIFSPNMKFLGLRVLNLRTRMRRTDRRTDVRLDCILRRRRGSAYNIYDMQYLAVAATDGGTKEQCGRCEQWCVTSSRSDSSVYTPLGFICLSYKWTSPLVVTRRNGRMLSTALQFDVVIRYGHLVPDFLTSFSVFKVLLTVYCICNVCAVFWSNKE